MKGPEIIQELRQATVVTDDKTHHNANITLYNGWAYIITSREEPNTPMNMWVPASKIKRVEP